MPRGTASKLRRRTNRKGGGDERVDEIFGDDDDEVVDAGRNSHDFGLKGEDGDVPLPPGMSPGGAEEEEPAAEDSAKDESLLPKKKKKKKKKAKRGVVDDDDGDDSPEMHVPPKKAGGGIKPGPLILLVMMTGTTLLPALIFASDYLGNFFQKHRVLGQIGFRLGMGAVPRKRVVSFYEKHDPDKLERVPDLLSKHYGDYPKLIKRLERKYGDYGYFLGWEHDEAAVTVAFEKLHETYQLWLSQYWNRYAPQTLKTAARNIRYNLARLRKEGRKVWKKRVWPWLEPIVGVPEGAAAQKRKDAREARRAKAANGKTGARRKNKDFRDDVED